MLFKGLLVLVAPPPYISSFTLLFHCLPPFNTPSFPFVSHTTIFYFLFLGKIQYSPTPHPGSLIMYLTSIVTQSAAHVSKARFLSLTHISPPLPCVRECVWVHVNMCAHTEDNPLLTPYGLQVSHSGPWGFQQATLPT